MKGKKTLLLFSDEMSFLNIINFYSFPKGAFYFYFFQVTIIFSILYSTLFRLPISGNEILLFSEIKILLFSVPPINPFISLQATFFPPFLPASRWRWDSVLLCLCPCYSLADSLFEASELKTKIILVMSGYICSFSCTK